MSFKTVNDSNIKDFKNFTMSELKCKCGGRYCNGFPVGFSYHLLKNLQDIRNHFSRAVIITSAVRCNQHNKNVGGVTKSKHKEGRAVDFYVKGISYNTLSNYVNNLPYKNYKYNISGSVMHYDINPPEEGSYDLTRLLKYGCRGNDVKELQDTLGGLAVDGIFGKNTKARVISFQKSKGLVQDGIVGKNTAHALGWTYKGE